MDILTIPAAPAATRRLVAEVPRDLLIALKIEAANSECSVTDLVRDALRLVVVGRRHGVSPSDAGPGEMDCDLVSNIGQAPHSVNSPSPYLNLEQVAVYFYCTRETVRRWVRRREISAVKVGRGYLFERTEIERFARKRLRGGRA